MSILRNFRPALVALVAVAAVVFSGVAAGAADPVIPVNGYERRVAVLEEIAEGVDRESRAVDESLVLLLAGAEPEFGDAASLARRLERLEARSGALEREIKAVRLEMREPPLAGELAAEGVDRWRSLVEEHFPAIRVEDALSIMDCESGGDPLARNPRSGASGLFQFLPRTWDYVSAQAGVAHLGAEDGAANIAAAAWLTEYSVAAGDNAWSHWTCRP